MAGIRAVAAHNKHGSITGSIPEVNWGIPESGELETIGNRCNEDKDYEVLKKRINGS